MQSNLIEQAKVRDASTDAPKNNRGGVGIHVRALSKSYCT
jgi:hypothetical protein